MIQSDPVSANIDEPLALHKQTQHALRKTQPQPNTKTAKNSIAPEHLRTKSLPTRPHRVSASVTARAAPGLLLELTGAAHTPIPAALSLGVAAAGRGPCLRAVDKGEEGTDKGGVNGQPRTGGDHRCKSRLAYQACSKRCQRYSKTIRSLPGPCSFRNYRKEGARTAGWQTRFG